MNVSVFKSGRTGVFLSPIFLFSVTLLGCLPLLTLHFLQLWKLDHYGFFPFVLLSLPYLIWHLRASKSTTKEGSTGLEFACFGVGGALLLFSVVAWSPNLAALAAVFATGGILLHLHGAGRIRRPFAVWLIALTLVRLPMNLDLDLIFWLQGLNSRIASQILDFVGITHVLRGHVIRVPGDGFLIEEACSGIQSLFTLIAAAGIALIIVERSRIQSLMLLLSAGFWACTVNTIRIASVVMASVWFGVDISSGFAHEMLGIVLFGVAIWMLYSSDSFLELVSQNYRQHAVRNGHDSLIAESSFDVVLSDSKSEVIVESVANWKHVIIAVVFSALGLIQVGVMVLSSRGSASINPDDPRLKSAFVESTLPETIGRWHRTGFQRESRALTDYMGRNSASWSFRSGDVDIVVSVDYPFLGWHELTHCYEAQGCVISERNIHPEKNGIRTVSCEVLSSGDTKGELWFSEFLQSGESLVPLGTNAGTTQYWLSRIQSSFLRQSASIRSNPSNYQIQLLATRKTPLSLSERDELLEFHHATARQIIVAIQEATK